MMNDAPLLVVITGMSGSGKSLAIRALEDAGFFCIDNLPVRHLAQVVHDLHQDGHRRLAVAVDARTGGESLVGLATTLRDARTEGWDVRTVYLNARTDVLVRRYSETRRRHPLSEGSPAHAGLPSGSSSARPVLTLFESIQLERELLTPIEQLGATLDTSNMHPNVLRQWVLDLVTAEFSALTLLFESFGYKHGVPLEADFVFDVRCLPNPYYDPGLRPLTGLDQPVIDRLHAEPDARQMIEDIASWLERWLPSFRRELRHYLTVAIGCTGGQHRSVYVAEALAHRFHGCGTVLVRHRSLAAHAHGASRLQAT